jgi:hypothetical protein
VTTPENQQETVCDGVPASVLSLRGQHDYTLDEWRDEWERSRLRMMRNIELKRRGLRFLPKQAIKRALRLHIHVLKMEDPPEYLVPLENLALRAHEQYA